jgi:hypothetical protein
MIVIIDSVLLAYLFQENKSYGSKNHLHSSSDVQRIVSGTALVLTWYLSSFYSVTARQLGQRALSLMRESTILVNRAIRGPNQVSFNRQLHLGLV